MTDKFLVPGPSERAVQLAQAAFTANGAALYVMMMDAVYNAMRQDLPRIVRAEVERALRDECRLDDATVSLPRFDREQAEIRIAAYLGRRFGEPHPPATPKSTDCAKCDAVGWHFGPCGSPVKVALPKKFHDRSI